MAIQPPSGPSTATTPRPPRHHSNTSASDGGKAIKRHDGLENTHDRSAALKVEIDRLGSIVGSLGFFIIVSSTVLLVFGGRSATASDGGAWLFLASGILCTAPCTRCVLLR